MRLPNFFIAGAPKAGSTSLYRYLDQHPQIFMSPLKEPHFFSDEIRVENFEDPFRLKARANTEALRKFLAGPMTGRCSGGPVSEWEDYVKLFRHASGEKAIGEASVCYLWSETAARNIAARIPEAKILIVLRNPVDRAFSQYVHMLMFAEAHVSFRDHMQASLRSTSRRFSPTYPFLEFGLYGKQIERLFQFIAQERVAIYDYEEYCRDPAVMLHRVFGFLGVDDRFTPDLSERHMQATVPRSYRVRRWLKRSGAWQAARAILPEPMRARLRSTVFQPRQNFVLDPKDRAALAEYYRADTEKLSRLLGRDFTPWLSPAPARIARS